MKKPILKKELDKIFDLSLQDSLLTEGQHIKEIDLSSSDFEDNSFEECVLEEVDLNTSQLSRLKCVDVVFNKSNLANVVCNNGYFLRTEISSCRMTGFQSGESKFENVSFKDSKIDLSSFRFSSFENVLFENCVVTQSEFIGTKIKKVTFRNCDLTNADFSQAKIQILDIRGSRVEGIRIQKESLEEVLVDTGQALYMAILLGLKIEDL